MVEYIYFVKCPDCDDEPFSFFNDAKACAMDCLSKKPIITQVEVDRNDFGECIDSQDLGTIWSWEDMMSDIPEDTELTTFSKADTLDYNAAQDVEFADIDGDLSFVDNIPDNFRKPVPEGMTIEQLVEEMEENEDTVECTWCEDLFDKSECRYEVNLGWLCSRCEAAIKSRGETLTFKENSYWDFLEDEDDDTSHLNPFEDFITDEDEHGNSIAVPVIDGKPDYSAAKRIHESLEEQTWTCVYDGTEVGTVTAVSEDEAIEKMQKEYPDYHYGAYDGCFWVILQESDTVVETLKPSFDPEDRIFYQTWDCYADDDHIGSVTAFTEKEALEQMYKEYPDCRYTYHYVEPTGVGAMMTEAVDRMTLSDEQIDKVTEILKQELLATKIVPYEGADPKPIPSSHIKNFFSLERISKNYPALHYFFGALSDDNKLTEEVLNDLKRRILNTTRKEIGHVVEDITFKHTTGGFDITIKLHADLTGLGSMGTNEANKLGRNMDDTKNDETQKPEAPIEENWEDDNYYKTWMAPEFTESLETDSSKSVTEDILDTSIADIEEFIEQTKKRFPGSEVHFDGDANKIIIALDNEKTESLKEARDPYAGYIGIDKDGVEVCYYNYFDEEVYWYPTLDEIGDCVVDFVTDQDAKDLGGFNTVSEIYKAPRVGDSDAWSHFIDTNIVELIKRHEREVLEDGFTLRCAEQAWNEGAADREYEREQDAKYGYSGILPNDDE